MALVKFGGGVVQMSGKIAGNVFARNSGGNYVRGWTKPVNPNSPAQQAVRSALSLLMVRWKETLTAAERIAWETYAAAVKVPNRFGEMINVSGVNMYIRSNTYLTRSGDTVVDAGPTTLTLPGQDPTFSIAASAATQLITVTFDDGLAWANIDDGFMHLFMGRPQNETRNFFAGPYRYGDTFDGDTAIPLASPQTFTAPFTIIENQKIWVAAVIQEPDARVSSRFSGNIINAA